MIEELKSGDSVSLKNGQIAKIISVIKEYGNICMVLGRLDEDTVLLWDHNGHSEVQELTIDRKLL